LSFLWRNHFRRLLLGLSLLAAAAVSGFLSMRYATRREITTLPSLIGLSYPEASSRAAALGLRIEISKLRTVSEVVPKTVLSQYPSEGTLLKSGQTIQVILSREKEPTPVPVVLGTSLRMAQMQLSQAGYRFGQICNAHVGAENTSQIVRYTTAQPSGHDLSETVDILINDGPEDKFYLMPDLVGKDVNAVMHLFDLYGISIKNIRYVASTNYRKGIIVSQQPGSGSRLSTKDFILLEASS
jgi:eukaryotic-like serine/threonine-protein kinase